MNFPDEQTERAYLALHQEKHTRLARARQIAMDAAWRDLPANEQDAYMDCAYRALRQTEKEMPN